jgi:hypothetical protein
MHVGYISTACFPDSRTFVTGGTDNVSLSMQYNKCCNQADYFFFLLSWRKACLHVENKRRKNDGPWFN